MPGPIVPTPEQVAYMLEHASDNQTPNIIACVSISATAATVFVALRLWSRRIHHGSMNLDASDYLALAAWVMYVSYNVVFGLTTRYGGGRHIIFVTDHRLLRILGIVDEHLFVLILAALKLSILSLYRKIFGNTRWFCILTWIVTAVVVAWVFQIVISTNIQCIPISYTWDPTQRGSCINYGVQALVAYIVDIITDLTILSMPIPLVWKLNTSKANKRGLLVVFAAGGSACLVSFIQLHYISKLSSTADESWDNIPPSLLATSEILVGFFATSIATYGPLYQFLFSKDKLTEAALYARSKQPINDHVTTIIADKGPTPNSCNGDWQRGIIVTDEIELIEHGNPSKVEPFQFN